MNGHMDGNNEDRQAYWEAICPISQYTLKPSVIKFVIFIQWNEEKQKWFTNET